MGEAHPQLSILNFQFSINLGVLNLITLARDGMRSDLERIWRSCFDSPPEQVKYFFDHRYNPNACAVYIDDESGRPVAMAHLLDASITEDGGIIPAQYICALATRPDHQGKGYMAALLEFARKMAVSRRQKYMIVSPGKREYYRMFERQGFYKCFWIRRLYMTHGDLTVISKDDPNNAGKALLSEKGSALSGFDRAWTPTRTYSILLSDLAAVRRDLLADREGYVGWDMDAIKFSAGGHTNSGGIIVAGTNGVDSGYAFCRDSGGLVEVSELAAHTGFKKQLIRDILKTYPQKDFTLRLPMSDEFFSSFGEAEPVGMIREVAGRKPIGMLTLEGVHLPYMGLEPNA